MAHESDFEGFPKASLDFYSGLKQNNNKLWFENHRDTFEDAVMAPARAFVATMGRRLRKIAPDLTADPRVNRSIFRINRDARFGADRSPYKTHLGIWFWDGDRPRMENSGFYFHVEPPHLMFGVGIYMFPADVMETYRQSVVDKKHGRALQRALAACRKVPGCTFGRRHYKRIPRGFPADHANAEYLTYNGLYAGVEVKVPPVFFSSALIDYCYEHYRGMAPLHRWIRDLMARGD